MQRATVVSHVEVLTPGERAALAGKPVVSHVEAGVSAAAPAGAAEGRESAAPRAAPACKPTEDVAADTAAAENLSGEAQTLTTEQQFQVAANRCVSTSCRCGDWGEVLSLNNQASLA